MNNIIFKIKSAHATNDNDFIKSFSINYSGNIGDLSENKK